MTDVDARFDYAWACAWLKERYPQIVSGLVFSDQATMDDLGLFAQEAYTVFKEIVGGEARRLEAGLESFALMSFDFIRLQSRFVRKGEYAKSRAADIAHELYMQAERMEGYYLDGLLLTYAFWTNHCRLIRFYVESFLCGIEPTARVLEFGFGHGLMARLLMQNKKDCGYTGFDLSPSSKMYASVVLKPLMEGGRKLVLMQQDVSSPGFRKTLVQQGQAFQGGICCELLEHVEQPQTLLSALFDLIEPGAPMFVSTVANVAAEDHIYLFSDPEEVDRMLVDAGFGVEQRMVLPLKGMESANPCPQNIAMIARRRA